MMSLWDALRMNMMISYQELVRTFLSGIVKNWLINPMSYDLYKQAPVLVDNVLKMLSPDGSVRQLAQSESQVG